MTFAVQIVARRFAFLIPQLLLLPLDPDHFRDCKDTNAIEAHALRCRDTHLAARRIDTEMDVLDVFEHHVHGYFAKIDLRDCQYSACALMIAKIRSTSSTFCNTSLR